MGVKRVPDGFHRVTPHLTVRSAAAMIDFYKKAFGAVEKGRAADPDGKSIPTPLYRSATRSSF